MSKFGCTCGNVIFDISDNSPFKACLLRNEVENAFWEEIHGEFKALIEAVESGEKAGIANTFGESSPLAKAIGGLERRLYGIHARRTSYVYECTDCGRLWVQKAAGNQFVSYVPEEGGYQAILSATSCDSESLDCE